MTTVICDLDGVVYTGSNPIARSAEALAKLQELEIPTLFATNNSTRTPGDTAAKITQVTGMEVEPTQIITSAQAAASLLVGENGAALVIGGRGIVAALEEVRVDVTQDPFEASVVVVGMDQEFTYEKIARASAALRNGARFVASNDDSTYPSPDGPLPGAGAMVASIAKVAGFDPVVAGKPHQPMRRLLRQRAGDDVWMVGDRVETDIAMAARERWQSILVLTGVTSPDHSEGVADFVAKDLYDAVRVVTTTRVRP